MYKKLFQLIAYQPLNIKNYKEKLFRKVKITMIFSAAGLFEASFGEPAVFFMQFINTELETEDRNR